MNPRRGCLRRRRGRSHCWQGCCPVHSASPRQPVPLVVTERLVVDGAAWQDGVDADDIARRVGGARAAEQRRVAARERQALGEWTQIVIVAGTVRVHFCAVEDFILRKAFSPPSSGVYPASELNNLYHRVHARNHDTGNGHGPAYQLGHRRSENSRFK